LSAAAICRIEIPGRRHLTRLLAIKYPVRAADRQVLPRFQVPIPSIKLAIAAEALYRPVHRERALHLCDLAQTDEA
jgi:hypothetical protein